MQRLVNTFFMVLSIFSVAANAHDLPADNLTVLVQHHEKFAQQFHSLLNHAKIPTWAKNARGIDQPLHAMTIGGKSYALLQTTSPDYSKNQNLVILLDIHNHKMWAMFESYHRTIIGQNIISRQWFGKPNYTQKRILLVSTIESIH